MVRTAAGVLLALLVPGCATSPFGDTGAATPETTMAGRWMLTAPAAPMCGMNFSGPAGARAGAVSPEGGCPGKFFMSRRWNLDAGKLTIADEDNQPLAALDYANGGFQGQAVTGVPVTLARPAPPLSPE